jgi:uncharacterized membrane protein YfcA
MRALLFPTALTPGMVAIVIVGVFLASFVDGVAGGGGIISVPTYFLAGLPAHLALGTNKLSSCIGTTVSAGRFIRGGYVDWRLGIPAVILGMAGAALGTRLQLMADERVLKLLLLAVLPLVAVVVLRQRSLPEQRREIAPGKQMAVVLAAALGIGTYDGFYGPGTGTFLLLAFCGLGKLDLRTAAGNVKLVNLASNFSALLTSFLSGKVFLALGLIAAVASIAGHWLGSGLAIKDGSKIVRPAILVVLVLLAIKVLTDML